MEVLTKVVTFIYSLDTYVFIALLMGILCLIFGGGIKNAVRSGLSFGVGLFGITLLMNSAIEFLTPMAESISSRVGISLNVIDLGYAAVNPAGFWPGALIVMFAILGINILFVALKLTKTLWTDFHNIWHGNFVGMIVYVITQNIWLGIAAALVALVLNMFLADLHAKRFQEFNGITGATVVASSGTFTATFSMLVMMLIDKIPFLKKIEITPEHIKDKFGILGESMTIGAILGIILGIVAGYTFQKVMGLAIVLAAILALFPRMAALLCEGIAALTTPVTVFLKKKFPGRELNIAVDPAVLLGHPSVMASFMIMVPLSILYAFLIPGIGFIPIASLTALPYWIGGIVPYTKGNILHTVIVASLWVILSSLIATQMATIITNSLGMYGFFTDQIAAGSTFTCWDECGNILAWAFAKLIAVFH